MKRKNSMRFLSTIIIIGFFIFIAFGSDDTKSSSSSKSEPSKPMTDKEYKKALDDANKEYNKKGEWKVCKNCTGKTCTRCFGRGYYYGSK